MSARVRVFWTRTRTGCWTKPGGGRGFGPTPKTQLAGLVRKIEFLTGDVSLHLTPDQEKQILTLLENIEASNTMTDEQAVNKHKALLAVLHEDQVAKQEAVALPRGRVGQGIPAPAPDANPFAEAEASKALGNLRQRLNKQPEK